jgi:hypothetical protein
MTWSIVCFISSGRGTIMTAPPNPRVQRTRPFASRRHSPLTRHPLAGYA